MYASLPNTASQLMFAVVSVFVTDKPNGPSQHPKVLKLSVLEYELSVSLQ